MGKVRGFMEIERVIPPDLPVAERVRNYKEFHTHLSIEQLQQQGARCMDCGVPTCHWGCPLGNLIPDWNDLVYRGRWQEAIQRLHKTNNFPEFTGRVCPAPCEAACILGINKSPVTIKEIELNIIEHAIHSGWISPQPPTLRTGKKVAVIGSGPAGMAAAQQLNRAGHWVTLFEKSDRIGGLLRYGIPDFKLEKKRIDFRVQQMECEGVICKTGVHVGKDFPADRLLKEFDAVVLTGGAMQPRDLPVAGRNLAGVHFAMDFLTQQNRVNAGDALDSSPISAQGKRVVILGGGDTGADCLGTSHRQGALSVHQFEILPKPPAERTENMPWPYWPFILRNSTSHEEGGIRDWQISTKSFSGSQGRVQKLHGVRVEFGPIGPDGRSPLVEIPGTEFDLDVDLVILAMGFLGPVKEGLLSDLGVKFNERGAVAVDENYMTSVPGVFAAGDMARGASLVVWAIYEGRQAAKNIDQYLMGKTYLK